MVYGAIAISALLLAVFLAADWFLAGFLVAGVLWLATLPFHAEIAYRIAMATFASAFVVPFLPGQPFVWEAAALIGWSGVAVAVMLRRYQPDFGETVARNKWVYFGAVIYCAVLLLLMKFRGAGLVALGSGVGGGRLYAQQMVCAIFPLLFAVVDCNEHRFFRLMVIQWVLAATYLISDFAFSTGRFQFLLFVLKTPFDASNFETMAMNFGIRRWQSFLHLGIGATMLLVLYQPLRKFAERSAIWLVPALLTALGLGLFSGHRIFFITLAFFFLGLAFCQRFFNLRNNILIMLVALPLLTFTYLFSRELPMAAQRAVSFMPGIVVDSSVRVDGENTMIARQLLRRIGIGMIPQYFWMGRGFTKWVGFLEVSQMHEHPMLATVNYNVSQGAFTNGPIGLMVNAGFFGFLGMYIFIVGGTVAAWRIARVVRARRYEDRFALACCVAVSYWFATVMMFTFLHGDAEYALRDFGLQAGMLILAERMLRRREQERALEESNG